MQNKLWNIWILVFIKSSLAIASTYIRESIQWFTFYQDVFYEIHSDIRDCGVWLSTSSPAGDEYSLALETVSTPSWTTYGSRAMHYLIAIKLASRSKVLPSGWTDSFSPLSFWTKRKPKSSKPMMVTSWGWPVVFRVTLESLVRINKDNSHQHHQQSSFINYISTSSSWLSIIDISSSSMIVIYCESSLTLSAMQSIMHCHSFVSFVSATSTVTLSSSIELNTAHAQIFYLIYLVAFLSLWYLCSHHL